MVLIGKITASGITCLLFKIREALDQNNVFMMCPLHALNPDTQKVKIQVLGDTNTQISGTIYITAALFPVQHTFLDTALGVLQNPEVINTNNKLKELSYLTIDPNIYSGIVNKKAQIYIANKTGIVNSIDTKIKDMNYELGSTENMSIIKRLPTPGGYILTEEDAVEGMSGSILVVDKSTVGMIVSSSDIKDNDEKNDNCGCGSKKSFSVAVDMYYLLPHITQCVNSIDKYTNNNPQNLVNLCNYTTMQTLKDSLKPVVCHLGADYIFNQISISNPQKDITLLNIHNYLEVSGLHFLQENISNSISVKTVLNSNQEFLDYFYNKQEDSVVILKSANYYDKVVNQRVDIDFVKDPLYANILDWSFRGDPRESLVLNLQTRIVNNDGSITLSEIKSFRFNSSPVVDTVFNQSNSRTSLEIPGFFFNKNNALMDLKNSFNMRDIGGSAIRIKYLGIGADILWWGFQGPGMLIAQAATAAPAATAALAGGVAGGIAGGYGGYQAANAIQNEQGLKKNDKFVISKDDDIFAKYVKWYVNNHNVQYVMDKSDYSQLWYFMGDETKVRFVESVVTDTTSTKFGLWIDNHGNNYHINKNSQEWKNAYNEIDRIVKSFYRP